MNFYELFIAFSGVLVISEIREGISTHYGLKASEEPSEVSKLIDHLNTLGRVISCLFDLLMVLIVLLGVTHFVKDNLYQIIWSLGLFIPGLLIVNISYTTIIKHIMNNRISALEQKLKLQQQMRGE